MNDDWLHVPPVDFPYYGTSVQNEQEIHTQKMAKAGAFVADENDGLVGVVVVNAVENDAVAVDVENVVAVV